ncbi:MAG TPA: hypothetical protein VGN11_12095 [Candidatus Baltobacteraceae bacterium]|nr:hypothetical protein [Candidatus Baltobacteraceae bacterium]
MDSAALRQVGAEFEAMLLKECLRPLERGTNAVASYGLDALARTIAQRDTHGFGSLLASRLKDDAEAR